MVQQQEVLSAAAQQSADQAELGNLTERLARAAGLQSASDLAAEEARESRESWTCHVCHAMNDGLLATCHRAECGAEYVPLEQRDWVCGACTMKHEGAHAQSTCVSCRGARVLGEEGWQCPRCHKYNTNSPRCEHEEKGCGFVRANIATYSALESGVGAGASGGGGSGGGGGGARMGSSPFELAADALGISAWDFTNRWEVGNVVGLMCKLENWLRFEFSNREGNGLRDLLDHTLDGTVDRDGRPKCVAVERSRYSNVVQLCYVILF